MTTKTGREIWILGAKRTAFGTFGGALKDLTATDLAVRRPRRPRAGGRRPKDVDETIFGNVMQTSADAIYLARHVGPARRRARRRRRRSRVNRLCGSGFQAIVTARRADAPGEARGRARRRHRVDERRRRTSSAARAGACRFGKGGSSRTSLWSALTDSYTGMPMAHHRREPRRAVQASRSDEVRRVRAALAEALGRRAGGRPLQGRDRAASSSRRRRATGAVRRRRAHRAADHAGERCAKLPHGLQEGRRGHRRQRRRHLRRRRRAGDGRREAAPRSKGLKPLAPARQLGRRRLRSEDHGHRPGAGDPQRARARRASSSRDVDLFEVNEAFAPQYLAVEKELGLAAREDQRQRRRDRARPPARRVGRAHHRAPRLRAARAAAARYGIGSACIGGGQGIAVVVEAL